MEKYDNIGNPTEEYLIALGKKQLQRTNQEKELLAVEEYDRRTYGVPAEPKPEIKPNRNWLKTWAYIGIIVIAIVSVLLLIQGEIKAWQIAEDCRRFAPKVGLDPSRC